MSITYQPGLDLNMRIIFEISVKFHMKNCQVVQLTTLDWQAYGFEFKISQACDTTAQKYLNLLLHYQKKQDFKVMGMLILLCIILYQAVYQLLGI